MFVTTSLSSCIYLHPGGYFSVAALSLHTHVILVMPNNPQLRLHSPLQMASQSR